MPGPVRRQQAGSIGALVLRWMTAGPRTVPAMCPKNGMNASSAFWSGKMATISPAFNLFKISRAAFPRLRISIPCPDLIEDTFSVISESLLSLATPDVLTPMRGNHCVIRSQFPRCAETRRIPFCSETKRSKCSLPITSVELMTSSSVRIGVLRKSASTQPRCL